MLTVYVTTPRDAAGDLAESLVEQRYAACVNVLDCASYYRWEGDVVRDDEAVLLAKTTAERADDLERYVADAHPHDVPCVERFEADGVLDAYADWVTESVEEERA